MNTNARNTPIINGVGITNFRVWLNKSQFADASKDRRIATVQVTLNGFMNLTDFKVMEDRENGEWYVKYPGKFIKTDEEPEGKPFNHVHIRNEDAEEILNTYIMDRVEEELEKFANS